MNRYEHGGNIYSRQIRYDFSANINPLGMPCSVKEVLVRHIDDYAHYPDVNCTALKAAIAKHENVKAEQIVCGNGAADLIYRIVWTLKPQNALLPAPTFSEYEKALKSVPCKVHYYMLSEEFGFALQEEFLDKIRGNDMLFLCNPNNPTGQIVQKEQIKRILTVCKESGCILVLDECFMDFVGNNRYGAWHLDENVIVLKAFTKIYAMAGLRLGYCMCKDEKMAEAICSCGQCWSVSVPAQLAGMAALSEEEYVEQTVSLIARERKYLMDSLRKLGLRVYASEANFLLFFSNAPLDVLLLKEGIAIRSCENYRGLRYGFFRIAVRSHEENKALIHAIERIL